MESILNSVKKQIGFDEAYEHFDQDLILLINSALSVMTQVGVGPQEGFYITGDSAVWSDFLDDDPRLEMVKEYVFLRAKVVFDPPQSGSVLDAYKERIQELEWRANVVADDWSWRKESSSEE